MPNQIKMRSEQPQASRWSLGEILVVLILIVAVVGGMSWWLKPWERWWQSQDEKKAAQAAELATGLMTYQQQQKYWPWNYPVDDYQPVSQRAEAAYVYAPGERSLETDRTWQLAWLRGNRSVAEATKEVWQQKDQFYLLKQISGGELVMVCFVPQSEQWRAKAAAACREDGSGLRDAPYQVLNFDPCVTTDGSETPRVATTLGGRWMDGSSAASRGNLWCEFSI